jgi:hypothetical protein
VALATALVLAAAAAAAYAIANGRAGIRLSGGPLPRAAATACNGPVTPVGHTESVNNTRRLADVLWIGGVVVSQGYGATKTVIEPNRRARLARTVLRGWRCSDGRPLRFWFRNAGLPWSGRGTERQLATTGSRGLRLDLARLRAHHWDTVGYVMFSSPGKWVVEARSGRRVLGTVLFDFPR